MRTTLEIDDAVLAAAKEIADAEHKTAGAVISELALKGLSQSSGPSKRQNTGFPTFSVPPGARPFTSAEIKSAITDEGLPPRR
jgi:hypothetical protein